MTFKTKSLLISFIVAGLFYLSDALLDHLLFYEELGFLQVLITAVPIHEVYTRVLGIGTIIILGIILPELVRPPAFQGKKASRNDKLSTDPTLMVNISNEIRTPLNAILGFVDLSKDEKISESSRRLYLNHIRTSGKYLLELINNITDITLIETGAMYLSRSECRVNQLMSRVQLRFEKQLAEKRKRDLDIRMTAGVNDENYTVLTDEARLYQILVNLMENALSHTEEGRIEFGYKQLDARRLEFFVKDNGAGVSPERLDMLFSGYKKLGSNQMRPFDIVSLRMNIVRHLVDLFGGDLQGESKLGKGSDFRFRLEAPPVSTPDTREGAGSRTKGEEEEGGGKWAGFTVLIAEDVESNFVYLKEILKPTGVHILWAENGKEAVELCREHKDIHLVLMDILMPEMDGYEAAKIIRQSAPHLPVIAQTAYNIDEMEYKDASRYFDKFMIKPIWSIDLLNTLSKYFDEN